MRKKVFGRKFKRDVNARKALFRSLVSSLILKERIQTTEAKAKAIKGDVDKLITKVKTGKDPKSLLSGFLFPHALEKLVNDVAPRFKERQGGYTRILRVGKRFGDDASMVLMEWTTGPLPAKQVQKVKISKPKVSSVKKSKTVKTKSGGRSPAKSKKK